MFKSLLLLWMFFQIDAVLIFKVLDGPLIVQYNEQQTFTANLTFRRVPNFVNINAILYVCEEKTNNCNEKLKLSLSPIEAKTKYFQWKVNLPGYWDDHTLQVALVLDNGILCIRNLDTVNQKLVYFRKLKQTHDHASSLDYDLDMDWGGGCSNMNSTELDKQKWFSASEQNIQPSEENITISPTARKNFNNLVDNDKEIKEFYHYSGKSHPTTEKLAPICLFPLVSPTTLELKGSSYAVFTCTSRCGCGKYEQLTWYQEKAGDIPKPLCTNGVNSTKKQLILNKTLHESDEGSFIYCKSSRFFSDPNKILLSFNLDRSATTTPSADSSVAEAKLKSASDILGPIFSGCVAVLFLIALSAVIFIKCSRKNPSAPKIEEKTVENDIYDATTGVTYAILDLETPLSNTLAIKDASPYTEIIGAYKPKGQVGF